MLQKNSQNCPRFKLVAKDKIVCLITDFSNRCTIQGVADMSNEKISLAGKIFWALVVSVMLYLSCYGSVQAYYDWQASPVINTVMSTGASIEQV